MALCPFATHKLIPAGSNDPRIDARAAILHVDAGNASSLYDYFRYRSGGIESHFFVKLDGTIEQYRDTAYQADANLDANDFAISIETQGFGGGKWTAAQLASIKRLLRWLHAEHGIPFRKIQHWDGSGVGYHTLFGAPSHWTPYAKTCPGPERIKQFNEILVPWFEVARLPKPPAPAPVPDAELVVVARNLYTASDSRAVRAQLNEDADKYDPDVFVLTEAASHWSVLDDIDGYTVIQESVAQRNPRGDDTGDCAILVADRVKIRHSWLARMTRKWRVFSHNVLHLPHKYEVVSLWLDGQRWRVRGSHWPTHGFSGGNRRAVLESARKSRRWLRRGVGVPSIDVGDLNETRATLAGWYGERFKVFGKRIDVAVTKNVDGCEWKELPKGPSDHFGRLYKFTVKRSK